MDTSVKGEFACLKFDQRCLELGYISARPIIETTFDRIIYKEEKFWRVQIKYSSQVDKQSGSFLVKLNRNSRSQGFVRSYTEYETDIIVAYLSKIDKLIWIPSSVFLGKSVLSFCSSFTKRKTSTMRLVEDFVF